MNSDARYTSDKYTLDGTVIIIETEYIYEVLDTYQIVLRTLVAQLVDRYLLWKGNYWLFFIQYALMFSVT